MSLVGRVRVEVLDARWFFDLIEFLAQGVAASYGERDIMHYPGNVAVLHVNRLFYLINFTVWFDWMIRFSGWPAPFRPGRRSSAANLRIPGQSGRWRLLRFGRVGQGGIRPAVQRHHPRAEPRHGNTQRCRYLVGVEHLLHGRSRSSIGSHRPPTRPPTRTA